MPSRVSRLSRLARAGLLASLILAVSVEAQDSGTDKKRGDEPDPPRAATYMGQLRQLWDKWDLDKDGFLSKKELAVAFYGPGSKAYDWRETAKKDDKESKSDDPPAKEGSEKDKPTTTKDKPVKKPDYSKRQDYNFLVMADTDADGQVSREEFMVWAREYATQLRDRDEGNKKLVDIQNQIKKAGAKAKNKKDLETKLKKQQDQINALQKKLSKAKLPTK